MTKTSSESKRGLVAPGSLFNTSEGLLSTSLTGIVSTIISSDNYSETLKLVAMGGLALTVVAYTLSRAWVKRDA